MGKEFFRGHIEQGRSVGHCAVVGMVDFLGQDVSTLTVLGLESLQHRGQDGGGLASFDPENGQKSPFNLYKRSGLVNNIFFPHSVLDTHRLRTPLAIGHTRYATAGTKGVESCLQPFVVDGLALSHNGNITNTRQLREELASLDISYQSDSDSELLAHLITSSPGSSWPEKVERSLEKVRGSYSLVMATEQGQLIAARDPLGVRPLWMGYNSSGVIVTSETVTFQRIPVHAREPLRPGEMIVIERNGFIQKKQILPSTRTAECLVERLYIGHVMSEYDDQPLKQTREKIGENLTREHPLPQVDIICGIPDSALPVAEGYARALGRRVNQVIIKDRYSSGIRAFIQGSPAERIEVLEGKFYISDEIEGKSVLVVDDSVIRGDTTTTLIRKLRQRGAREVHVGSGSPKFVDICDLGTDIASLTDLVAVESRGNGWYRERDEREIAREIGADSTFFLSLQGLVRATGRRLDDFCTHCWTHEHPIRRNDEEKRKELILKEANFTPNVPIIGRFTGDFVTMRIVKD